MNVSLIFLFISPFCSPINRTPDDFNQCDQDNIDQASTVIAFDLENPIHHSREFDPPKGNFHL